MIDGFLMVLVSFVGRSAWRDYREREREGENRITHGLNIAK